MMLYEHQKQVLDQTKYKNRVAYYLDMGLGKTYVGAEKLHQLGQNVNLVICQKSKIDDWINHFVTNYSSYQIKNLTKKCDFQSFICLTNSSEKYVGIINYELAWRRLDLLKLKDFTLMLDESSLIQNDTAKQSKFILNLNPANVILLSGTPTAGKYENMWSQAHLLGWKISKPLYESQYINYELLDVGGTKVWVVNKSDPYKNVERLKQKMRDHGAVFMKSDDVIELPQQNFINVTCNVHKNYKMFIRSGYAILNDIEFIATNNLTKRLCARQLASAFNDHKLEAVKDLIQSTNDRIIIFYNFNVEKDKLKAICDAFKRPISVVNGSDKDLHAYEHFDDSISLIQYQAGAMGLNLQKANKVIYFSLPERSELFEQSKKRIHRIGQNHPCFYYIIMAKGTIDEAIYKALLQRKDYTDELFRMDGDVK